MPPPPVPQIPAELTTFPYGYDVFAPRLGHRSSQESAVSSSRSLVFGRDSGMHTAQPTRQPHGSPQEQARGVIKRPSRELFNQIRPIGHGRSFEWKIVFKMGVERMGSWEWNVMR
jgi:hypothetical protein